MTNAYRDDNNVPTKTAALNTDGVTIVRLEANASTNRLLVSNGTLGSDHGPKNALRDENEVPVLMAVSSADGQTPIILYADSSGHLLIKST